jgi:outer membrane protein insertion porin family
VVADVRIVGNHHTKDVQIFDKIKTRRDSEFDPEQIEKDVRSLDSTGRFRNIITHQKTTKDGIIVTFELIERPYIQYVVHHGNRGLSEKKLNKEHGLKVGDALSAFNVREGRRKIEELYHQNGFPKATVLIQEGEDPKDKGVVYVINEGPVQRVSHVTFMGNRLATSSRLETFIQSKPGYFSYASPYFSSRLDRQKLEQDVDTLKKYYRSLGYFRAEIGREVVADDSGKWVTINFIIDEGPRYKIRNISIGGSTKFDADKLTAFLKLKKGDHFSQDFMERDRNLLTDLYGTQGHAFADINAEVRLLEEPGELDVVYNVTEGAVFHVGEINVHIAGGDVTPHTKETVVLNRLNLRHGDLVDSREVKNGERRLKASNLFVTNPQEGDLPRIVIKEPRFDVGGLAESPRSGTVRGQSPEPKESPEEQVQRLAQEQQNQESRYGRSIYSWDGPRQTTPHETSYRAPRVPASQPRASAPQSSSASR